MPGRASWLGGAAGHNGFSFLRIRSPSSRFLRFLACMMRARSITRTVVGDLDGAAAEISTICHWTRRMEVVWAAV